MTTAVNVLQYVEVAVFFLVAAVATQRWVQRRGAARAWLAATFGLLMTVSVAGLVLPEEPRHAGDRIAQRVLIWLLVLFPYCLYRVMASFEAPPRWLERVVTGLVGAAMVSTLLLPATLPGPD